MNIQNLSLLLSDKVSNRKILTKFKQIKDFYLKSFEERKNIIASRLSFTLKNAYENIPYFYKLAEENKINDVGRTSTCGGLILNARVHEGKPCCS